MFIVGLTGGVATGKSTVVGFLQHWSYPVFDAYREVALLHQQPRVLELVAKAFPEAVTSSGFLSKRELAEVVFADSAKLALLEEILHPPVQEALQDFLERHRRGRRRLVFLDVPLLWRSPFLPRCKAVWMTTCREALQRRRVLARPDWDQQRWEETVAAQAFMRDHQRHADHLLNTGGGKARTVRQLRRLIANLLHVKH